MKKRLMIVVDGGLVTDVITDNPKEFEDVEVLVLDQDVDGVDTRYLAKIIPKSGRARHASLMAYEIGKPDFVVRNPRERS